MWQTSRDTVYKNNSYGKDHRTNDLHLFKFSVLSRSEALRQTNLTMKDRFEGLSAWREKQRADRDFLESKLEEARVRMDALTLQNQELSRMQGEEGKTGGLLVSLKPRNSFFCICDCLAQSS